MNKHEYHTLKKVTYGTYKKWVCVDIGCKFNAQRPIDILGEIFHCTACKSIFSFSNEDIKQKGNILCPMCSGIGSELRIVETEILNNQYRDKALDIILDESAPSKKRGRPPKTAEPIKEAMTEETQALTEAMIMAGIAGIKLKKIEESSTDPNAPNTVEEK